MVEVLQAFMDVFIFEGNNPRLSLKWGTVHYLLCLSTIYLGNKLFKGTLKKAFY